MLNFIENGASKDTPLVIAHGLFGSARNWGVVSKRLSNERRVLTVDMRNHGASPWFQSHSYNDMAADLATVIARNGGCADVLGHSMGGKAAMVLALKYPELVRRLIVVDIAPLAYGHTQAHLIEAMQGLDLMQISQRREADNLLARTIDDAPLRAFLLQSLNMRTMPPRWALNLKVLRRYMPEIIGFPQETEQFSGPVLFLTGGNSDYVPADQPAKIRRLFPKADFQQIEGAGHWLHAEKPREFEAAVRHFLRDAP